MFDVGIVNQRQGTACNNVVRSILLEAPVVMALNVLAALNVMPFATL